MRILHTSDWHLGRSFGQHRLLEDQARFIDWLVDFVRSEDIDLVVISGDLYDRSIPPADAVELLSEALRRLCSAGAEVAAIAGNHDSPERVAAYDGLTELAGVVIRGGYRRAADVTMRQFDDGPLAIVAAPFLDPHLAPPAVRERSGRCTHESVLAATFEQARRCLGPQARSIVVSHAFVTGAVPSSSERELAVGTAGMVSADIFSGFSYVALGHLHQPQVVAGDSRIRYSGSPLPYSFSETGSKQVNLVELDSSGGVKVSDVPVPVGRPVVTVRGRFSDVCGAEDEATRRSWVRVELTDPTPVVDAHRRLRDVFPHLVEIERVAPRLASGIGLTAANVRRLDRAQVGRAFWHDVTGEDPSGEVAALLAGALTAFPEERAG